MTCMPRAPPFLPRSTITAACLAGLLALAAAASCPRACKSLPTKAQISAYRQALPSSVCSRLLAVQGGRDCNLGEVAVRPVVHISGQHEAGHLELVVPRLRLGKDLQA